MPRGKKSFVIDKKEHRLIIPGYPVGSDLTIINTAYIPLTKNDDGEWEKDYISILFRDNKTGEKRVHTIYEPLYSFYKLKNEDDFLPYNRFFIEKDKVEPITCTYSTILKCIAEVTDNKEWFMNNINNGESYKNKALHNITYDIFFSDMNVENYYRFLFGLSYTNNTFKLSKSYLDIETDGRYAAGEFPEPGEVPINAIAFCDEANNITYQFLLDDPNNPSLQQYKIMCERRDMMAELKKFVIDAVGGYKKAVKFGVDKMEYKLIFFEKEIDLIATMFKVINASSPDFLLIWNMAFDLTYIIARIEMLGYMPADIICDKRIQATFLRYYVDTRNKNDFAERGDFVNMSTHTVWLDQMIQFASRRKGRGQYQSFRLDAIGEVISGVRKLDYSHITKDINMLPYIDYKTFSFYNVMDVIVQKCIEASTQDCEYVFTKCLVNNTIYPKAHRQSVYLANRFAKDFYEYGYIIGNNKNLGNEKPKTKFPGAMVGEPTHNDPNITMHINGRPTMLIDNTVDFD